MSSVWAIAVVDGEGGKELFLGREDGTLSRYTARMLQVGGQASLTLPVHSGAITAISAATADEVTSCSVDGTVKTTATAAEVEGKREGKVVQVGTPLRCMLATAEQTFTAGHDGAIYSITADSPKPAKWAGHSDWVASLATTEAGYLLSASYDCTVRVWEMATGKTLFSFSGHGAAVKTVQSVGPYIYTASRDETIRLWALPEAGEAGEAAAGEAAPAAEVDEDGNPVAGTQQEVAAAPADSIPQVQAAAVIELPETPHCSSVSGSNLFLGFTDGRVVTINTKDLGRTVQSYQAEVSSSYKKCKKHLDTNAFVAVKNLKIRNKKAIKKKKKEMKEAAANAAKAAAKEAADKRREEALAAGAAVANEDEDGEGEAEPAEVEAEPELGEDGEEVEVALSEEQEKELADFLEQAKTALELDTKKVQEEKSTKVEALHPITQQKFLCEREKFDRLTFTRTYGQRSEGAALGIVVDGITAYTTAGETVKAVECRPGVMTL